MKKASTKPISSPGRAEKYPPPLMRFLRSNVGSRSRGRSRSSPMFVLRKKTAAIETQEPTSPKVTCMGQVRVRRSSKQQPGKRNGAPSKRQQRCRCLNLNMNVNKSKQLFCHCFEGKTLKGSCFRPDWWWKWKLVRVFRVGWLWKKTKIREDSVVKREDSRINSSGRGRTDDEEGEEHDDGDGEEDEEEEMKVFVSSSSTPPKNAFLLTRCRSAPYRSSSLASRFWGSPLRSKDEEQNSRTTTDPTSGTESSCRDSDQESRMDPETEEKQQFDDGKKSQTEQEKEEEEPLTAHRPITLTRCKSEPARTGQRLDPDLHILKKKYLGFT